MEVRDESRSRWAARCDARAMVHGVVFVGGVIRKANERGGASAVADRPMKLPCGREIVSNDSNFMHMLNRFLSRMQTWRVTLATLRARGQKRMSSAKLFTSLHLAQTGRTMKLTDWRSCAGANGSSEGAPMRAKTRGLEGVKGVKGRDWRTSAEANGSLERAPMGVEANGSSSERSWE